MSPAAGEIRPVHIIVFLNFKATALLCANETEVETRLQTVRTERRGFVRFYWTFLKHVWRLAPWAGRSLPAAAGFLGSGHSGQMAARTRHYNLKKANLPSPLMWHGFSLRALGFIANRGDSPQREDNLYKPEPFCLRSYRRDKFGKDISTKLKLEHVLKTLKLAALWMLLLKRQVHTRTIFLWKL